MDLTLYQYEKILLQYSHLTLAEKMETTHLLTAGRTSFPNLKLGQCTRTDIILPHKSITTEQIETLPLCHTPFLAWSQPTNTPAGLPSFPFNMKCTCHIDISDFMIDISDFMGSLVLLLTVLNLSLMLSNKDTSHK